MKVLVIDVGGNNIKVSLSGRRGEPIRIPSGPDMTAPQMAAEVKKAIRGFKYDAVSIGYPGPVVNGRPAEEPAHLGPGWRGFDYKRAFGKRVRVVNDAAMQALGSYQGGRMLFLGLGTGLGSALVVEGVLAPMELAHLPYKASGTYEDFVGVRGLKRLGRKKWTRHVHQVVALLKHGLQCDYVVLGGGQTRKLKSLPPGVRVGGNANAILGGIRLWNEAEHPYRRGPVVARSQSRRPPPRAAEKAASPVAQGTGEAPSAS